MPGRVVVIEGIDGSGKGTQAERLRRRLNAAGVSATVIAFPRYHETRFGQAIARYLNGEFGPLERIPPEFAALLFAGDRFESKPLIEESQRHYECVIFDRYVPSNLAHQGARVSEERWPEFRRWLEEIEYDIYGLPRPDLVIWLDVPTEVAQALVRQKGQRRYTPLQADLHEANRQYLDRVAARYRQLAEDAKWVRVPVVAPTGRLRSIEEIHGDVWRTVSGVVELPVVEG